jgi:hypothetical protein
VTAKETEMTTHSNLTIRLDDCTDWGMELNATDTDKAAYERAVADAISEAYPGADVTVQCLQIVRPRAVVTTRAPDGRILCDVETSRAESGIEETVLGLARDVWDAGDFWPTDYMADDAAAQVETHGAATRTFAVWGRGIAQSAIVRAGKYDDRALTAARKAGFNRVEDQDPNVASWYVIVMCDESTLDAQTRFDSATVGYCEVRS